MLILLHNVCNQMWVHADVLYSRLIYRLLFNGSLLLRSDLQYAAVLCNHK